jgi:uroporphyrinogen-III synthase
VLPGTGVILTRPPLQARALAGMIEASGGRAILFPALEIVEHQPVAETRALLDAADIAIFISANAVEFGLRYANNSLPTHLRLAAIGQMTAQALRDKGYDNIIVPEVGADSEALLAATALQALPAKSVVIFRGVGGRETLRSTLCQRGAKVAYIECYRRRRPDVSARDLEHLLRRNDIAAIQVLSRETLGNFCNMIGPSAALEGARILGFGEGVLTGFGDEGLLVALEQRFGTTHKA